MNVHVYTNLMSFHIRNTNFRSTSLYLARIGTAIPSP